MGLMAGCTAYAMRICIAMTIIVMVVKVEHKKDVEKLCPQDPNAGDHEHPGGNFEWSESHQGLILSAFYYGYVVTHIPAGIFADIYGGKWTLTFGIFWSSLCSILSPVAVHLGGSTALIVVRVMMGCAQGFLFPSLSVLISRWVPKKERASLGVIIVGGAQVGTIFGNAMSGYLLHNFAWDSTFYFFGSLGMIWCLVFMVLCYSDPGSHPFIKESERDFLFQELGSMATKKKNLPPTPWCAIMKNVPMIALLFAQIGHDWGFFIMVCDLPKYMGEILQVPIKEDGVYTAIPYLAMWIVSLIAGFVTDWLIDEDYMSITNTRKLMTSIAAFGPAIFIVAAAYVGCHKILSLTLFTFAMGTMGTYCAGMKLGPIDMSPNYSGTLTAIVNGLGAVAGIFAPYITGVMTKNFTLEEWLNVFWLAFFMLFFTCIIYDIWASGEVQDFNDPQPKAS